MNEGNMKTMNENEIEVALTRSEIERLLHEVNNRACAFMLCDKAASNPWGTIREKLIVAIQKGP